MNACEHCRFCRGMGCLACDGERLRHRKNIIELLTTPLPPRDDPFGALARFVTPLWLHREFGMTQQQAEWFMQFLPLPKLPDDVLDAIMHGDVVLQSFADCVFLIGASGQPIYTAHYDNPGEMLVLQQVFGKDAIDAAFSEGGDGMMQVMNRLVDATT